MPEKYVVMGFDDGITQDVRIMEILKKYNLRATFFINSGLLGADWTANVKVSHVRYTEHQIREGIYDGFEVEAHSKRHPSLKNATFENIIDQVQGDIDAIADMTGAAPKGLAYPGGTKDVDENVVSVIEENTSAGYGRTTTSTDSFELPERFLYWNPTAHVNSSNAAGLAKKFVNAEIGDEDMLLCFWGHGYEFDQANSWDRFESLCKYLSEQDDLVFVTYGEFYELFKDRIPRNK